jgi:glutamyl-Q tRNA(Asp) synthetase
MNPSPDFARSYAGRYVGRFAPSPTGPLHQGSLVAALASWLDARHHGGTWLLRIEDLDPPRESATAPALILSQLTQLGLFWDGEPLLQSHRVDAYEQALQQLVDNDRVFACACSRRITTPVYGGACRQRRLSDTKSQDAMRFEVPDTTLRFTDQVLGQQEWNLQEDVGDFVIKRRDGLFAYQLAVTVDDAFQQVTHVVRGSDLLDSTPRQISLAHALQYPVPLYAHIPVLVDDTGKKLSKSEQATQIPSAEPLRCIRAALKHLGQAQFPQITDLHALLAAATQAWRMDRVPRLLSRGIQPIDAD